MAVNTETPPKFELVHLKSGEYSIRSHAHGETMHIGTGPRSEALTLHVEQQRLVERALATANSSATPFVLWDVGLGAAGNALTAIDSLRHISAPVEIHSFEIETDLLEFALLHSKALDYLKGWEAAVGELLSGGVAYPLPHIRWVLHRGDFHEHLTDANSPSSIFHDPYSPAINPAMWSIETFSALRTHILAHSHLGEIAPCLLTNYTRSTAIRATLALSGWCVGIGVPTGGKDQTTIAATRLELLERPLGRDWLSRVRASTNAAPFRNGDYAPGPISNADFAKLEALPQFTG